MKTTRVMALNWPQETVSAYVFRSEGTNHFQSRAQQQIFTFKDKGGSDMNGEGGTCK